MNETKLNPKLVNARNSLKTMIAEQNALYDQIGDKDISKDSTEYKQITELSRKIEEASDMLETLAGVEGASIKAAKILDITSKGGGEFEFGGDTTKPAAKSVKQISDLIVNTNEFKSWLGSVMVDGRIPDRANLKSPTFAVPGGMKTLLTGASSTSAGALVATDFQGLLDMGATMRPLMFRDLITNGNTTSDLVEFAQVTGFTNNAAPIAEATATADGTGEKPESAMALAVVQAAVKTIAHYIPATRRAIADAGQLRTMIDLFLRYGLEEKLEDQILNGAGTGENFTGIHNTTGIQTQAYATNLLTTTRKARTKVKVTGRATPTAFVLHPNDWEAIDLLQDAENRYYFGGPMVLGTPRLWGLPVVESEGQTEGQGLVGDMRMMALWDREQANILISDSHSDFFIRNLVAVLAELRAAFGVLRPAAFVEIDLTA